MSICKKADCGRDSISRDMCGKHYQRARKNGEFVSIRSFSVRERFEGRYTPVTESGCWIWDGSCFPSGYGCLSVGGVSTNAHRVSYELYNGPIPEGLMVLHSCDVRECVNPAHLRLGTQKDNMADRTKRKRYHNVDGENNFASKLSNKEVLSIRADERAYSEIASDFSIHPVHVGRIKRREIWKHI